MPAHPATLDRLTLPELAPLAGFPAATPRDARRGTPLALRGHDPRPGHPRADGQPLADPTRAVLATGRRRGPRRDPGGRRLPRLAPTLVRPELRFHGHPGCRRRKLPRPLVDTRRFKSARARAIRREAARRSPGRRSKGLGTIGAALVLDLPVRGRHAQARQDFGHPPAPRRPPG